MNAADKKRTEDIAQLVADKIVPLSRRTLNLLAKAGIENQRQAVTMAAAVI